MNTDGHTASQDSRQNIRLVFLLNLFFTVLVFAGRFWTNSLIILSDAIHDLGDSFALGQAWFFENYSKRKGDQTYTYGYRRFSLLGAFISSAILLVSSVFILSEAIPRIIHPESPMAEGMLAFSIMGILVNGFAVFRLKKENSMNARVAALHLLEDVLGWAAALIVSVILLVWDVPVLDPLLSIFITLFIFYRVLKNLKKMTEILLQAVPDSITIADIRQHMLDIHMIESDHHMHAWSLDGTHHVLTAHLVLDRNITKEQIMAVKTRVKEIVEAHKFSHSTIEIEFAGETCRIDSDHCH
jgi:cobalt-zinc-cadmium efflux system protein